MRGAMVLDVAAGELEAVRARLASAPRPPCLRRATFEVHEDGRASWSAPTVLAEIARVLQSVALAACVSVAGSLAWNWMFYVALPVGFVVGVGWSVVAMSLDRRRLAAEARRFLRSAIRASAGSS